MGDSRVEQVPFTDWTSDGVNGGDGALDTVRDLIMGHYFMVAIIIVILVVIIIYMWYKGGETYVMTAGSSLWSSSGDGATGTSAFSPNAPLNSSGSPYYVVDKMNCAVSNVGEDPWAWQLAHLNDATVDNFDDPQFTKKLYGMN